VRIEGGYRAFLIALAAACHFQPATVATGDATRVDGDGEDQVCFGRGLLSVCLSELPTTAVQIGTDTPVDTGMSSTCAQLTGANAGTVCVVAGTSIAIASDKTLTGTGSKPLVLLATTGEIDVSGTVDVASHTGGTPGADADPPECSAPTAPDACTGGGGGGFGGPGGAGGGVVDANCNLDAGGNVGPAAPATPTTVHGGCPGAPGGVNQSDAASGASGHGGGAVYLIAATSISVTGTIDASGQGGGGGTVDNGGGGGGGAGGMIGLDAPTITIQAAASVFANGGGGGEGARGDGVTAGHAGADPTDASTPAAGGTGTDYGGDGGAGAQGSTLDGTGGSAEYSGGGGGGGAGVILHFGTLSGTGVISPAT